MNTNFSPSFEIVSQSASIPPADQIGNYSPSGYENYISHNPPQQIPQSMIDASTNSTNSSDYF